MFKLPGKPTPKAEISELADYMELLCWIRGRISRREMMSFLNIMDDNLDDDGEGYEGCKDADEKNGNLMDETLIEMEFRQDACNGGYPFGLDKTGTILRRLPNIEQTDPMLVYLYLLVATRLNMRKEKVQATIDGALAMEKVSAAALRKYLGKRCRSEVFGTSSGGIFKDRIEQLCKALKEPSVYSNIDGNDVPVHAQDDKLDVVAWLPFVNRSPGQLIIFAQSKTGTSWRDKTKELSPEIFQKKWLSKPFLVAPIRAFCVSESVVRSQWNSTCVETGLLFDRCRLIECCDQLEEEIRILICNWVVGAKTVVEDYLNNSNIQ